MKSSRHLPSFRGLRSGRRLLGAASIVALLALPALWIQAQGERAIAPAAASTASEAQLAPGAWPTPYDSTAPRVICPAGSTAGVCQMARRIAEMEPCTQPQGCRAYGAWRNLTGEPGPELAARWRGDSADPRLGSLLGLPSEDRPDGLEGLSSPLRQRVIEYWLGSVRRLETLEASPVEEVTEPNPGSSDP